jgi:hypothetical protein
VNMDLLLTRGVHSDNVAHVKEFGMDQLHVVVAAMAVEPMVLCSGLTLMRILPQSETASKRGARLIAVPVFRRWVFRKFLS